MTTFLIIRLEIGLILQLQSCQNHVNKKATCSKWLIYNIKFGGMATIEQDI